MIGLLVARQDLHNTYTSSTIRLLLFCCNPTDNSITSHLGDTGAIICKTRSYGNPTPAHVFRRWKLEYQKPTLERKPTTITPIVCSQINMFACPMSLQPLRNVETNKAIADFRTTLAAISSASESERMRSWIYIRSTRKCTQFLTFYSFVFSFSLQISDFFNHSIYRPHLTTPKKAYFCMCFSYQPLNQRHRSDATSKYHISHKILNAQCSCHNIYCSIQSRRRAPNKNAQIVS